MSSSKRGLTIRSSRDRFAAAELFCKLSQRRGRKALRLNSGVRLCSSEEICMPILIIILVIIALAFIIGFLSRIFGG